MNKIAGNRKEKPPKDSNDTINFTLTLSQQNAVIREWLWWVIVLPLAVCKFCRRMFQKAGHLVYCFFTE